MSEKIIKITLDTTRKINERLNKLIEYIKLEEVISNLEYIENFKDDLLNELKGESNFKEKWLDEIKRYNDQLIEITFNDIELKKLNYYDDKLSSHIQMITENDKLSSHIQMITEND